MRPLVVDDATAELDDVAAKIGRHKEFESFYRSNWTEVYRPLAVTLRDPDLAREAVDEAMIRTYRHWRKIRDYENQAGWVYRVAFNWALSQLRRTRREILRGQLADEPQSDRLPPVDLYDALAALDLRHRSVVVLRYLLDWSEEEVANVLGIARGTVKSRLHRAIQELRNELT